MPTYYSSESSDPKKAPKPAPIEVSSGDLLTGGVVIELLRNDRGVLRFLKWDSKRRVEDHEVLFGEHWHQAADLDSSMARIIPFPTTCSDYRSTQDLFNTTVNVLSIYGVPPEAARTFTYIGFGTWGHSSSQPPPIATVCAQPAQWARLRQLLGCVVRRGVSVVELTPGFLAEVVKFHPTLFFDGRHLGPRGRRLLAASCRPGAYLAAGKSVVNLSVPKIVYLGPDPDPDFSLDFSLHVNLPPVTGGHRLLTGKEEKQLQAQFQPWYAEYRIRNLAAIQDSNFDVPELADESRLIAQALGACIVDAPDIQSGVRALLEDREEETRESRFTDHKCIAIEALFVRCHEPKRHEIRVKEVAADVNALLKLRGEDVGLKERKVGKILKDLGVRGEPHNRRGVRILLNAGMKRHAHMLARDHKVESIEQVVPVCALCKEILGGVAKTTAGNTTEATGQDSAV